MAEWLIETREAVEIWTINGEKRWNTLNQAMVSELASHLAQLASRPQTRAVVLTGAGSKAFCAGADLKERQGMSDQDVEAWLELLHSTFRQFELAPQIFIAAMNGAAFGGGLEMALACDLRVADARARMGLTEVKLGIIPGAGGTQRLTRVLGPARAKELIFSARHLEASQAGQLGLVNQVSEEGQSLELALDLAAEIVANAPLALAQAKSAINEGLDLPWEQALALEREKYRPLLKTQDRLEGLAAFLEKRPPLYRGE